MHSIFTEPEIPLLDRSTPGSNLITMVYRPIAHLCVLAKISASCVSCWDRYVHATMVKTSLFFPLSR